MNSSDFEWQGHRGARGLLPENTIPSFLKALEDGVQTLELDVAISKDRQVIISHEPWMSHHICSKPDGTPVTKSEAKSLKILEMTYEQIQAYDCGSRGNDRFDSQQPVEVHKPSLAEMVDAIKAYCGANNRELPRFNIEIKSKPEADGIFTPTPDRFVDILLAEVDRLDIRGKTIIQSFDERPLRIVHERAPDIPIGLLVENISGPEKNIENLGFKPDIYSPYYKLLRRKHIKALHAQGIRVIPWTVNSARSIKKLRRKGVDGIITDYTNLIAEFQ